MADNETTTTIAMAAVILLVATIAYQLTTNESEMETFAKYLNEDGWHLAGVENTAFCQDCELQKSYFGEAMEYIPYHDCDLEFEWCREHNVFQYPTWVHITTEFEDGSYVIAGINTYVGLQSLEFLIFKSDYAYVETDEDAPNTGGNYGTAKFEDGDII